MSVFSILADNLNDIMTMLITNDDIKRLLANNSRNALNEPIPTIPTGDYFDKYIFDLQKLPNVSDEVKTFICTEFVRARKAGSDNTYQYNVELHIDILTHIDTWKLYGKRKRIYTLSDLIDIQIKSIKTSSIKGEFTFSDWSKIIYDSDATWQGRRLIYTVTNSSQNCG